MANAQGQAQAALNQVNAKIAAVTSQINDLKRQVESSLQSKASRMSDADQERLEDQIDVLINERSSLQDQAEQLAAKANPNATGEERFLTKSRQQDRASMRQGWNDEVAASEKATKTGNPESRPKTVFNETTTEQSTTVTGGGTTILRNPPPTPEQEKYYSEYKAAQDADIAANNTRREEYLRSKGLESATGAQKRAAVRAARENGELPPEKEPGSDFIEANPNAPPNSPVTITKEAPTDNGTVSERTVERTGASANTAGDKVTDAERPPIVNDQAGISEDAGTGKDVSGNPTAEELTDEEKANLDQSKNSSTDTDTAVVTPTTTASGNKVTTTSTGQSATKAKEGTLRNAGDVLRSGQANDSNTISVGNTGEKPTPIKITPNPLHAYATYTYSISLHLLTPEAYNKLAIGEDWLPDAKTLIAGGGRWGTDRTNKNTFTRATQFKDDFYFDGLNLETVIGLNTQSKGANAIEFKFTIVEPYGFTLINRLLELGIEMNQPNYLTNPYVLQIDFFGNNDAGEPLHPCTDAEGRPLTKYLPCRIVEIQAKVGTSGATYACRAAPYNHAAFSETVGVTPANFEIVANTVGNFFTNDADDAAIINAAQTRYKQTVDAQREQKAAEASASSKKITPEQQAKLDQQAKKIESNAKAPFQAKSYTGAYNAYQQYLVLNKFCESPVIIKFNIDPEIANSKIVLKQSNSVSNTPSVDTSAPKAKSDALKSSKAGPGTTPVKGMEPDVAKFNVNAGDQILELINKVMRNSTYITDQLKGKDPVEAKDGGTPTDKDGKPLKWFKVIPQLKLTKFDKIRNDWGSEIVYHIVTYTHHNSKHPAVSKSNDNEIRKGLRKRYSYIYSGENNDIISFALDFNTVFYTAVNVMTENSSRFSTAPDGLAKPVEPGQLAESKPEAQVSTDVQRNQIHLTTGDLSASSGLNAVGNPAAQRAADVMKSIYSSARGDMINVQLKIVGDPDFIKTDDVYYNPGSSNYPAAEETHSPDGSILTDRGDIFALLSWRTPADLDQETGLPDFTRFQSSAFDGVYKIIKVTCDFAKGGFDQSLDMIRYHDGVTDIIEETGNVAREKAAADTNAQLGETVIEDDEPRREISSYSYSKVEKARAEENRSTNTDPDDKKNEELADVTTNGEEIPAETDSTNKNNSQDSTNPTNTNAQAQSPQADGGPPVKNEGGSQPQADNPPKIDNNNLPAGVVREPDTGLYTYRGRRFSANDSADLAAKTKAIDDGTTVKTTKTDAESGTKKEVEFNGNSPPPLSKDDQIAEWQADYESARNQAANAQRRLDQANSGLFDDNPFKKQTVIDNNTKSLEAANAKMTAIEAQLKARGAAPT
jgi:hypothetical protein